MTDAPGADPFGTASLRAAALAAWASSPTRLREDANLEEDHGRGFYRDRVVVELAQNAADAAGPEGGRLLLDLVDAGDATYLVARNTGVPLTAAGVASLASLRASSKHGKHGTVGSVGSLDAVGSAGSVGRFGVGFSAVRSVADDVVVLTDPSGRGDPASVVGVAFSLARTRAALARLPGAPADLLAARGDALPVLRLPFPASSADVADVADALGTAPPGAGAGARLLDGLTTAVVVRLRDEPARAAVRAQLDAVDPVLLLALPSLDEVVVRVPAGDGAREPDERRVTREAFAPGLGWHVASARGTVDPALVADRPVEERGRTAWTVTWALRAGAPPSVVHAPTPTDEPLALPGVLVASLPLDATRRHVARGPLAEHVLAAAGRLYAATVADVVRSRPAAGVGSGALDAWGGDASAAFAGSGRDASAAVDGPAGVEALALVPGPVPAGWADAVVRVAALEALADVPLFDGVPARSGTAIEGPVGADAEVVAALRPAVPGLATLVPAARTAARTLGLAVRPLADVVDDLAGGLPPGGWRRVLAALAPHADASDVREAFAGLPVPVLADLAATPGGPVGAWGGSADAWGGSDDGRAAPADPGADAPGGPSATGRTVLARGPRGLVVGDDRPEGRAALAALARLGARVVHPDAAHPLLSRLGAVAVDDPAVLDLPAVRAAVGAAADGTAADGSAADGSPADGTGGAADVLAVVEGIVRAHPGALAPGAAGLGGIVLPAVDPDTGRPVAAQPAADLALPGSWAAAHLDLDVLDPATAAARDPATWAAVGVRAGLAVLTLRDVVLPEPDEDPGLPGDVLDAVGDDVLDHLDDLADALGPGVLLDELTVVAPLDAAADVDPATLLAHVLADPDLRRALVVRVRAGAHDAPSHLAGWLRARLDGPLAVPGSAAGVLLRPVPDAVARVVGDDPEVWHALGAVGSVADADDAALAAVLDALPPEGTRVPVAEAVALWRRVRAAADEGAEWEPGPERVVAWVRDAAGAGRFEVRAADDVRVATHPGAAVLGPVVPAARGAADRLADALDLDVAADDVEPDPPGPGTGTPAAQPTPAAALRLLAAVAGPGASPAARDAEPVAPATCVEHEALAVAGQEVAWWPVEGRYGPVLHVATTAGLAAALAWATGRPGLEHAVLAVLDEPDRADEIAAAAAWD